MSLALSAKRRRLNDSANTLAKPFVSPFKIPKVERTPLRQNDDAANIMYQPSTLAHTIKATRTISSVSKTPRAPFSTPTKSTPIRKQAVFAASLRRGDPAELAAQKAITSLELQIRSIRNEIDSLTQAVRLSSSNNDSYLEDLALKWKLASQEAAEELFGSVKERVCRMGGVAAWRESEKKKLERSNGYGDFQEEVASDDADCRFDSQGEELPEDEQEYRKLEKREARKEMEDTADLDGNMAQYEEEEQTKVWQEDSADDDAFTMDMMLRSLNIELDVIGYDKVVQKWVS